MRIRGSFIFTGLLLLVSILFLIVTLAYPLKAKLFPLLALFILLTLLIIQIIKEFFASKGKKAVEGVKAEGLGAKYLTIWLWIAATTLILWIFGFMGTVILLPFLYLRFQRESWLLSITVSLGCGVFFYTLFDLFLRMPLYPGLLFTKIFG